MVNNAQVQWAPGSDDLHGPGARDAERAEPDVDPGASAPSAGLDAAKSVEDEFKQLVERVVEIEGTRVVGLSEDDESFYAGFSKAQRRRVRTKIDLRLLPSLCILYLFAQLDRSNIGNAKIEGFKEDTRLSDGQYNIALAVFFIPYFFLGNHCKLIVVNSQADCLQRCLAICFSRLFPGHLSTYLP